MFDRLFNMHKKRTPLCLIKDHMALRFHINNLKNNVKKAHEALEAAREHVNVVRKEGFIDIENYLIQNELLDKNLNDPDLCIEDGVVYLIEDNEDD